MIGQSQENLFPKFVAIKYDALYVVKVGFEQECSCDLFADGAVERRGWVFGPDTKSDLVAVEVAATFVKLSRHERNLSEHDSGKAD